MGKVIWCVGLLLSFYSRIDLDCYRHIGDIIYLEALGQPIIILNSVETVGDLFERRSALYSDRPETVFIHQLYAGTLTNVCTFC